jgi:hypothetical protein
MTSAAVGRKNSPKTEMPLSFDIFSADYYNGVVIYSFCCRDVEDVETTLS